MAMMDMGDIDRSTKTFIFCLFSLSCSYFFPPYSFFPVSYTGVGCVDDFIIFLPIDGVSSNG